MTVRDRVPDEARGDGRTAEMVVSRPEELFRTDTRRGFLRMLGVGGSIVLLPSLFACSDDDDDITGPFSGPVTLDLSTDVGILNYAYALEQLEAGFYEAVVASAPFNSMSVEQKEVFVDLRNHEVIHREFFFRALGPGNRIGNLELNATTVASALASVATILRTSEAFEDLGVAAYNGAGKYLSNADNLLIAGKIVSVEARHAAAIRDIREAAGITAAGVTAGTRFAGDDVVVASGAFAGLDVKLEPSAVLSRVAATNFVTTPISIGTQPPTKSGTPDFGPPNPTP